jgi:hypothetical protein
VCSVLNFLFAPVYLAIGPTSEIQGPLPLATLRSARPRQPPQLPLLPPFDRRPAPSTTPSWRGPLPPYALQTPSRRLHPIPTLANSQPSQTLPTMTSSLVSFAPRTCGISCPLFFMRGTVFPPPLRDVLLHRPSTPPDEWTLNSSPTSLPCAPGGFPHDELHAARSSPAPPRPTNLHRILLPVVCKKRKQHIFFTLSKFAPLMSFTLLGPRRLLPRLTTFTGLSCYFATIKCPPRFETESFSMSSRFLSHETTVSKRNGRPC